MVPKRPGGSVGSSRHDEYRGPRQWSLQRLALEMWRNPSIKTSDSCPEMPSVTAFRFLTRALKQSHPARMLTLKSNTNICTNCRVNINAVCCFLFVTRASSPHQHEHTHMRAHSLQYEALLHENSPGACKRTRVTPKGQRKVHGIDQEGSSVPQTVHLPPSFLHVTSLWCFVPFSAPRGLTSPPLLL